MTRCINIDWLEIYALEDPIGYPHDADYFRRVGFHVEQREYGTPVYHEMFVIYGTDNQPLIEVRRNPKSAVGKQVHGVLDANACHVRLTNRTCYFQNAVQLMQEFLERYGLHYQRISRIDICLDFETFDYGDKPADFMARYMKGRYSKINQCNITSHGADRWDGRVWNSVSWGNKKSMVGTKFYNKTKELAEVRDKPYIRQAWRAAGLIDDDMRMVKFCDDGTERNVEIWRVEFSIKSSTRNWFIMEDENGQKRKIRSVKNTLQCYDTKDKLWTMFTSLADHYFHFKKYQEGVRKDRCPDKPLFRSDGVQEYYKLENVATIDTPSTMLQRLLTHIRKYAEETTKPEVFKACLKLEEDIEFRLRTTPMTYPWNQHEVEVLRWLISKRIKNHDNTLCEDRAIIESILNMEGELF